jgi:hypothetical protein
VKWVMLNVRGCLNTTAMARAADRYSRAGGYVSVGSGSAATWPVVSLTQAEARWR